MPFQVVFAIPTSRCHRRNPAEGNPRTFRPGDCRRQIVFEAVDAQVDAFENPLCEMMNDAILLTDSKILDKLYLELLTNYLQEGVFLDGNVVILPI